MLKDIPIVGHFTPDPTAAQLAAIDPVADAIRRQHSELSRDAQFRRLSVDSLVDGACLHLDDLSEISYLDGGREFRFIQDRARLRAGDGDLVASLATEVPGYETYCQQQLGLGAPQWLRPAAGKNPLKITHACWQDRGVRRELVHRLRADALHYLHPHMGTFGVWELAALLHERSRRPVKVIAPPPVLSRLVNHKGTFADMAAQLLGPHFVPETTSACSMTGLCQGVADIALRAKMIGLKRPDAAGGDAIVILPAERVRGESLSRVREMLDRYLFALQWDHSSEVLVDVWESEVIGAPSSQLWIPGEADGPPVVEGVFTQFLDQEARVFVGAVEADLPADLQREFVTCSWLLARLFQKLGYVGRCSFDAILVGESLRQSRLEFVECNGRWGGTSLPMTLMNRTFADWRTRPFAMRVLQIEGLSRLRFHRLCLSLGPALYDDRTGTGRLIVTTPGRMCHQSAIDVLALGNSRQDATDYLDHAVPALLKQAVESEVAGAESDDDPLACSL